jgi:hypothetical protein
MKSLCKLDVTEAMLVIDGETAVARLEERTRVIFLS